VQTVGLSSVDRYVLQSVRANASSCKAALPDLAHAIDHFRDHGGATRRAGLDTIR
jgi:hypothetical protein